MDSPAVLHSSLASLSIAGEGGSTASSSARGGGGTTRSAGLLQDEDLTLTLGDDDTDFLDDDDDDGRGDESFDQDRDHARGDSSELSHNRVFRGQQDSALGGGGGAGGTKRLPQDDIAFGGSMGVVSAAGFGDVTLPGGDAGRATTGTDQHSGTAGAGPATAVAGATDSADAFDLDYDEDLDGEEGSGMTEDEKKRILELREERDGLRTMNKTLGSLVLGLKAMDSRLQVRGGRNRLYGLPDLWTLS